MHSCIPIYIYRLLDPYIYIYITHRPNSLPLNPGPAAGPGLLLRDLPRADRGGRGLDLSAGVRGPPPLPCAYLLRWFLVGYVYMGRGVDWEEGRGGLDVRVCAE